MASQPQKSAATAPLSQARLWAEQLAMGMALLMGLLIFMAIFHVEVLSGGARVLGPNYLKVYGWASLAGIVLQVIVHEAGTLITAKWFKLPLHFRLFGFGANATATLESVPRNPWVDAVVGFAGPVTGTLVSLLLTGIFLLVNNPDNFQNNSPFFLGMACVGFFYNLFTLIPILDLEGGWIAPAIAPQAWLFGLIALVLELTQEFNLVLLCVVSFGLPKLILLILARAQRLDIGFTRRQQLIVNLGYFILVFALAWLGTSTFDKLPDLVRDVMGD
jgi:hypothetical protein